MSQQDVVTTVTEALRDVVEPEIGVNIVDLGLLYDVRVDDDGTVQIDVTLTAPSCPDGDLLRDQVHRALRGLELPVTICANWVWKPMWGPERVTEDGRDQLRALGYHV